MIIQPNDITQLQFFRYENIEYPPDDNKAQNHRKANTIFKNPYSDFQGQCQQTNQQCPCCGRIIGQPRNVRICYDSIELGKLHGPGLPLYFCFLRFCIYLLLILVILFGIIGTVTNLTGDDCSNSPKCKNNDFTNKWSILNTYSRENIIIAHKYLLMCIIILSPFYMLLVRTLFQRIKMNVDRIMQSQSDYSIIIRKINKQATIQDIRQMLLQFVDFMDEKQRKETHDLEIAEIYMAYQQVQYLQQKQQNIKQFKKCLKNKEAVILYSTEKILHNPYFTGTAIVCFQYHQSRQYFVNTSNFMQKLFKYTCDSYYRTSDLFRIRNKFVSVYRAPQPQDIIWENCGISTLQSIQRKFISYTLSIIILFLGLCIQFGLQKARYQLIKNGNFGIETIWGIGEGIIIMIINDIINIFLLKISQYQKDDTRTQTLRTLVQKILLFNFINSGIFIIIADILAKIPSQNAIVDSNLSLNIIYIIITNAIYQNILVFIFTFFKIDITKIIGKYKYRNNYEILTQRQLNKLMELPDFDIVDKFAYILRTIWLTAFFVSIVPIISIISFLGLFINYWVQKFLSSKYYKQPSSLSHYLAMEALQLLTYFSLWLIIGSFLIHLYLANFNFYQIPTAVMIPHYIGFVVSIFNIFVPYASIDCFNFCWPNDHCDEKLPSYNEAVKGFEVTYDETNPFYSCNHHKIIKEKRKLNFKNGKSQIIPHILETERQLKK